MNQKVLRLTNQILDTIGTWAGLEAVSRVPYLNHGRNNPLFYLKFDVYFNGDMPCPDHRLDGFKGLSLAETAQDRPRDRFFLQEVPVHIEYIRTAEVNRTIEKLFQPPYDLTQESTYSLFRLLHGIPLLEKSPWLKDLRLRLDALPDQFWPNHQRTLINRLEHRLSDMGAAIFNQDPIHYQVAFARYLENLAEALFTTNREFLGPTEELFARVQNLENLPAGFDGLFGNLLRDDGSLDKERRLEIARLLTQSLRNFA